jgi:hypothetical protein
MLVSRKFLVGEAGADCRAERREAEGEGEREGERQSSAV